MQTVFNTVWGNQAWTTEIIFPGPRDTFAVTSLVYTSGGGTQACGIAGCRFRPEPDGSEVNENYGAWPDWRASKFAHRMTSITFGIATGEDQEAKAMITLFFS